MEEPAGSFWDTECSGTAAGDLRKTGASARGSVIFFLKFVLDMELHLAEH